MAFDVYASCPCGSGKKLKFCCIGMADDMERISRLMHDHQMRQAQQLLETLLRKHPENAWAVTTRSFLDLEAGDAASAIQRLSSFLEKHPEHEFAIGLYALARLRHDGPREARKDIQRALQRCAKRFPDIVSNLLEILSLEHLDAGHYLAAREHLVLAARFCPEKSRENLFMKLLELDRDTVIPYPFRSVHKLPDVPGEEPFVAEVKKALKYTSVGCWDIAADLLLRLTTDHPDVAEQWHAIGLCRAASGAEAAAAEALHRAAAQYAGRDAGTAVECETLSQLLAWNSSSEGRARMRWCGEITASVSKLLTLLDELPFLQRVPLLPESNLSGQDFTAVYEVLERPFGYEVLPEHPTLDCVVRSTGSLWVRDRDADASAPAQIWLQGVAGEDFDRQAAALREVTAADVRWNPEPEIASGKIPEELLPFFTKIALPLKSPTKRRRAVTDLWHRHLVDEVWFETPLRGLHGRTPREAAADPSLRTELLAAVYVLDASCEAHRIPLDLEAVFARLGLEPLPPIAFTPETSVQSLSALQLQRLPVEQLTDEQLVAVVNRVLLIGHRRLSRKVLTAVLQRPECLNDADRAEVYQALYRQASDAGNSEEAFEWIAQGRQHAQSLPHNFVAVLHWDLNELGLRLRDPDDPQLPDLLNRFDQYYLSKVPNLRPSVERMCQLHGVTPPWLGGALAPATAGTLWTPESASEPVAAGKLWLPGQ
uniref:Tetratricopeptide repeat protein n=1 Tax=Schlesneria paludicola TaxID=360056 RepID=A0A7C4LLR7_9PLAN